jgi:hypothetical protein
MAATARHVDGGEALIASELLADCLVPNRQSARICSDLCRRL